MKQIYQLKEYRFFTTHKHEISSLSQRNGPKSFIEFLSIVIFIPADKANIATERRPSFYDTQTRN